MAPASWCINRGEALGVVSDSSIRKNSLLQIWRYCGIPIFRCYYLDRTSFVFFMVSKISHFFELRTMSECNQPDFGSDWLRQRLPNSLALRGWQLLWLGSSKTTTCSRKMNMPFGNQTWQWTSTTNGVSMGKSSVNGGCSSHVWCRVSPARYGQIWLLNFRKIPCGYQTKALRSMDWWRGNVQENHGKPDIQWEDLWFPVDFPNKTNPLIRPSPSWKMILPSELDMNSQQDLQGPMGCFYSPTHPHATCSNADTSGSNLFGDRTRRVTFGSWELEWWNHRPDTSFA